MHVNYIFQDEAFFSTPWKQMLINLYPQVFQDGAIDLQIAQQLWEQEENVHLDSNYGFNWPGKSNAQTKAFKPEQAMTLVFDEEDSKNPSETHNVYITGDNLSVLQTLYQSLRGLVACIVIDPPYNTTSDFIYDDDKTQDDQEVLNDEHTQLLSEQGQARRKVSESDRRHSNWLNMMYPRLQIAKTLLKDDGHIFICIDDNEITNLRMICNEIFGESRFVCQATWVSNKKGRKLANGASITKEYILCYRKKIATDLTIDQKWASEIMPDIYKNPNYRHGQDDLGFYTLQNQLYNTNSKFNEESAPTMVFDIFYHPERHEFKTLQISKRHQFPIQSTEVVNPYAEEGFVYIPLHPNAKATHHYHAWRWSQKKVEAEPHNLWVDLDENGAHKIWTKVRGRKATHTGFKDTIMGRSLSTTQGAKDIQDLNKDTDGKYPLSDMFQFPKPVMLIQALIESCTDGDDLILDFFSGSGTTAHAVMTANARDGEKRRFMLVQLPEQTYEIKKGKEVPTSSGKNAFNAGYRSIDMIARERIRRVESQFDEETKSRLDCGFQAYHIAKSWHRPFPNQAEGHNNHLLALRNHVDHPLREGWSEQDLLTECLLRLHQPVPHRITNETIDDHQVWIYHGSKMMYFAIFDQPITADLIEKLRDKCPNNQSSIHIISLDNLTSDSIQQLALQGNTNDLHFYLV